MKRSMRLLSILLAVAAVLVGCDPATSPAGVTGDTITFVVPEDAVPQAWATDITGPEGTLIVRIEPEPTRCDPGTGLVIHQCLWLRLDPAEVVTIVLSGSPPSFGCAFWTVVGLDRYPCQLGPPEGAQ